jgi:ankyrin repeat protein
MSDEWWDAVTRGNVDSVRDLVERFPELMYARDSQGQTGMHAALYARHTSLVAFLCAFPRLVSTKDDQDAAPIHIACETGSMESAAVLLQAGADPNAKKKRMVTPIMCACESNSLALVKMLERTGAHCTANDFLCACRHDRLEIVQWMIRRRVGRGRVASVFSTCVRFRAKKTALWIYENDV